MARLLKTLTLAGIAYALWQYLKMVLDEPEADPVATAPYGAPAEPSAKPVPASSEKSSEPAKPAAKAASNGGGSRSKAELYEEAQRLGIEGRSKMSKAELERAIREAG